MSELSIAESIRQDYEEEIERLKEQLNDEIQEELKQSEIMLKKQDEIERLNNIINNIDKKCKYLLENEKVIINEKTYYKQKCDDIITNFIYEELKGSDKE